MMVSTADLRKQRHKFEEELKALHDEVMLKNARITDLQKAIEGVKNLLVALGEPQPEITSVFVSHHSSDHLPSLRDFLFEALADMKEHTTENLLAKVKEGGFTFDDGRDPYKSVNMTLLGLARGPDVTRTVDGKWFRSK